MAKIYIGIPTVDGRIDMNILGLFAKIFDKYCGTHIFAIDFLAGSIINIGTSRNVITNRFLLKDFDYLYFWDADIAITDVDFLEKLFETMEKFDAGIVGGIYRIKDDTTSYACGRFVGKRVTNYTTGQITEPMEVDVLGNGSMLIKKEVFAKVKDPWFQTVDYPGGVFMPEDYNFCLKAKDAGIKIACDPRFKTFHYGMKAWEHTPIK